MTIIPTVKEQARRWASGRTDKATDKPGRETIDTRNLKVLGRIGRSSFATTQDKRELKVKGPARPEQIEQAAADAVLVRQPVRSDDGRTRTDTYIGTVVEPGTFEKLQRRKVYRGPKERRPGPVDGLAELRTPAARQIVTLDTNDDGSPEADIMGALSKRPLLMMTDSRATPMTVRRLIEVANAEGANVRRHHGHALADWTHAGRWRPLLVALWPLIEPTLAGAPPPCSYEHADAPVADTLDPAGVPVCNACVGWEPDAA